MTIEECIEYFEIEAEMSDSLMIPYESRKKYSDDCKQMAEWLRELKAYRKLIANADKLIESEYGVVIIEGYKDILAQMKEIYGEVTADED